MNEHEIQAVEEMTVKKKRQRPEQQVQTLPGDNTKYINHSLRVAGLGNVDMSDNTQVSERCREYFEICAEDDMKPSVAGLAVALGIDRKTLWQYRVGSLGKNKEVADTLKKASSILDQMMNDYMQNGKINPVSGIFLMKNNFDYADKQEVVITPKNPLGESQNTAEIEQRYIESVAEDIET